MTEFLVGAVGSSVLTAFAFAHRADLRIQDLEATEERLRAALGYLLRASREQAIRRYIARVLDPDGDEAGA